MGYRITGRKQWISNGGVADIYTILALAPGGPSWFVVDADAEGFSKGKSEDKHGIRASNTAALFLDNVYVPADPLIGLVEGQGLAQAQAVFGYTPTAVSISGIVVFALSENRIICRDAAGAGFIAFTTCDGSSESAKHAEPEEAQIPS